MSVTRSSSHRIVTVVLTLVVAGAIVVGAVWLSGDLRKVRLKPRPAPEVIDKMPQEEGPDGEAEGHERLPLPNVEEAP
jgi:hypothetical protein